MVLANPHAQEALDVCVLMAQNEISTTHTNKTNKVELKFQIKQMFTWFPPDRFVALKLDKIIVCPMPQTLPGWARCKLIY